MNADTRMEIDFGPTFDWFEILGRLADGATISNEDYTILYERAGSWPACACGQLCTLLPRRKTDQSPEDQKLNELGLDFSRHVGNRAWDDAYDCFLKIEKRSTELLKNMGVSVVLLDHPRRFERVLEAMKKLVIPKSYAEELAEPKPCLNPRLKT